ncbi:MAG: hypothetical protein RLZZ502_856 [Pseudomonadota bacterium]
MRIVILLLLCQCLALARAQEKIPIFDAHLHYNVEAWDMLPPDKVVALLREHHVVGVLANSRPNAGTQKLLAYSQDRASSGPSQLTVLTVVPFVRVYRDRSDYGTWYKKTEVYEHILAELAREPRSLGIGEFHLHGDEARHPGVKKIVELAQLRGLWLHAHVDEAALRHLLAIAPKAKIIWAHTGFSTEHRVVADILRTHPNVVGELSYRGDLTEGGAEAGKLTPEWRDLFGRFPERFMLGSDTWVNQRWDSYGDTMRRYRAWLAQLPPEVARKVAYENAAKLLTR